MQNNNLEIKSINTLKKISVADAIDKNSEPWTNKTLCKANDSLLRVAVFEGEFKMHKHEHEDEVFFVLEGSIVIETDKGSFSLKEQEGLCVPKGIMHRPIAEKRAIVLMVENDSINITGD